MTSIRTPAARRPADLFGAMLVVVVTAAVLPFVAMPAPSDAEYVVPGIYFTAGCAEIATFMTLRALYRREPHISTMILVGGFVFAGLLAVVLTFTTPVGPGLEAIAPSWAAASSWIYLAWHVGVSLAVLAYAMVRSTAMHRRRVIVGTQFACDGVMVLSGALALAVFAVSVNVAPNLPVLSVGDDLRGFWTTGVGPFALAFQAAILLFVAWTWTRGAIPRPALLGYAVIVLEFALRIAGGERFTFGWYLAHAIFLVASTFVLGGTIRKLLAWRDRAEALERDLEGEARQAELHAKRLASLSRLVSPDGSDHEHLNALLAEGGRNVQMLGAGFHGIIVRVDGDEIVVVASLAANAPGADLVPRPGTRFRRDHTLFDDILATGHTTSWPDARRATLRAANRLRTPIPWAAVAGTPFLVDGGQYVLGFGSSTPLPKQFEPLDHAYIETLASLCTLRLQEMEQRDRLRRAIEYDPLTGTLNRTTFRERVSAALRAGTEGALIVVDVDRFREFNEALGYHTGDVLLAEIAAALHRRTVSRDALGRLGDDRFAIFAVESARERVELRAASYLHAFDSPFLAGEAEDREVTLTASVGIALTPADGTDFEQLVVRAEAAVFAAKEAGGSRSAFFDGRAEERFVSFRRMKCELTEALAREQFVLHYQPHVELATGRVSGVEALLRWNHPQRGLVPPNAFLPFAEEHGLIGPIGAWVLEESIRAARRWRRTRPDLYVWFNLSAAELTDPSLVDRLHAFGSDLTGVGVEITETVAMDDVPSTTRTLAAMREAGLRIALDDFGTGYSSLAHLKRLPIDVVKVDRAFISGVPDDVHDVAIVEAVLGLASCYGFETVAEGVESDSQVAWLAYVGCTYAQGFAYAKPMPEHELDAWLQRREPKRAPQPAQPALERAVARTQILPSWNAV